jgi:hypothetical protein
MEFKTEIKTISVSHSMDLYKNGEKSSHFLSMNVDVIGNVPVEKLLYVQLEAAYKVTIANIYNSVMRNAMTMENAKEKIDSIKEKYEIMKKDMETKFNQA